MGSIRPSSIKRIAEEFAEKHQDKFNEDFNNNKAIIKQSIGGISKKTANVIAGYVTRYVVKKKEKLQREMEENVAA